MTDPPVGDPGDDPAIARPQVRRVDERLGLAICRIAASGRTLVTYARDHVTVRTPSRPDLADGNTLDLLHPPAPSALTGWVERFRDTTGNLGAERVQLRWEEPLDGDAAASAPPADPALVEAAGALGLELTPSTALLLEDLQEPETRVDAVPLTPPTAAAGVEAERLWHATGVLYRYRGGDTPEDWRAEAADPAGATAWRVEVQRELALAGRATVWLVTRHGGPAARLTLFHDRQGLAAIEDVVVHPVHRRRGIAAGLSHRAVSDHLASFPGDRVGLVVAPASVADRLYRRLGFRPHATVWRARGSSRPPEVRG